MVSTAPHETWVRAIEPEPSVTITEETFFGHGWQPLTIAAVQAIWFLPAGEEFGIEELVAWFRAMGWKSANGRPLGEDAVRRELALIRKAGYIRTYRLRGEGGRLGGVRYEISKRPKAPQAQIEYLAGEPVKQQVAPDAADDLVRPKPGLGKGRSRRWDLLPPMAATGGSPLLAEARKPQVAPVAADAGFPPTPPLEVVVATSPGPPRTGTDPESVAAAEEFLQDMPAPWAVGRTTARRYAPILAESAESQGWELDEALVRELTKGPMPRSPQAALKIRIQDLVRRERAGVAVYGRRRAAAPTTGPDLPPYCGDLDCDELTRMRTVEDEQGRRHVEACAGCHPLAGPAARNGPRPGEAWTPYADTFSTRPRPGPASVSGCAAVPTARG